MTAARNLLDQPNTPRTIADAPLSWRLASDFIVFEYVTALRQHGLDDEGEIAFRRGYDRGLAAQLANPNGRVEIKVKT